MDKCRSLDEMKNKERNGIEKLLEKKKGKEIRDNVENLIKKMRREGGDIRGKDVIAYQKAEEIQKRKRGQLEMSGEIEEEIFKRNRLMERSPEKKIETQEERQKSREEK